MARPKKHQTFPNGLIKQMGIFLPKTKQNKWTEKKQKAPKLSWSWEFLSDH